MIQIPVEPRVTEYLHNKASHMRIPLSGTFELTPVCNMDCRMCYVRMSKAQQESIAPLRTAEEWIELGRQLKEQGMLYLLITGGEPFLRPDIRQILSELHKMGFILSINTNGTLITEETVEWLKTCPPIRFNITLYGASDETYGRLCANPKGFTQATRAITLLQEAGMVVKINVSITPHNKDDLAGIIQWTKEHKLLVQASSYMFPPLRKDATLIGVNDRFTPEDASYYSAKVAQLVNGDEYFMEHMASKDMDGLDGDQDEFIWQPETEEEACGEGTGMLCRAGKCCFWVTWDGRFLPCGMFPGEDAPNVFAEGVESCWKQAVAMADAVRLPYRCKECDLRKECRVCAAMTFTETGAYDKVPEYRCRMAHAYYEGCRRVAKEIEENGETK